MALGIPELQTEIRELREALEGESALEEIAKLKRATVEQEIELDRVNEKHARETREIDHKLGLHRKRVEQEMELATQEARLEVQKENIDHDRKRFEDEIQFTREAMESEMSSLRELLKEILQRVPTVEVVRKEMLTLGGGNGNGGED